VFGYLQRELIGHTSLEFIHVDDRQKWLRAWGSALADAAHSYRVEIRSRRADGEWRLVSADLTNRLADEAFSAVVIDCEDVTDLRATQTAALAAERALELSLGASQAGMWTVDAHYRTIYANATMASLLGVAQSAMTNQPAGDEWVALLDRISNRQLPGTRITYQLPVRRADGTVRWLVCEALPHHDQLGRFTGCTFLCRDRAQRKLTNGSAVRDAHTLLSEAETEAETEVEAADERGDEFAAYAFTSRETDIVVKLLRGFRVPSIAESLFVSQSTIRSQLAVVFRKVGVSPQQQLIDHLHGRAR
jgi:PAS domain S-box-containing protein